MRRNVLAVVALAAVPIAVVTFLFVPAGRAIWTTAAMLVFQKQQEMQQALASGLRLLGETGPVAAFGLIGLSFLYGIVHALGPGHGKAIISAYVLADGRRLRQGLVLAWAASALQALMAITLVTAVVLVFGAAARETQATTLVLERLGYGLVVLIGFVLSGGALRRMLTGAAKEHLHCHCYGHHDNHPANAPRSHREGLRRGLKRHPLFMRHRSTSKHR